ncbi:MULTISPECIES: hypothetical protein [Halomonadaceae]|uniref:hypothetical protein n=1 Tax=Halomonadaceae TaxID=28256 RepID=UPI001583FB89|nr:MULTISPECIES: hypothetical protein [Halomonas]MDI4637505.1 hypothetical protein [Halomonas sp. BMC7]NUJ61339.1 hypothetical protein [Halomonas taeanensis]
MGIFDKLRKAKQPPKEEEQENTEQETSAISEKELNEKLKGFLYSDDLVAEYIHIFRKLYEIPEFKDVMEIIEAKETELNSINDSQEYFKQESEVEVKTSDNEAEEEDGEDYLMTILNERYGD